MDAVICSYDNMFVNKLASGLVSIFGGWPEEVSLLTIVVFCVKIDTNIGK